MTPNSYKLIQRCVEDGIKLGINRAHKHIEKPTAEQLTNAIEQAVMHEIYEWFDFEVRF
jgi:hypothetical protein